MTAEMSKGGAPGCRVPLKPKPEELTGEEEINLRSSKICDFQNSILSAVNSEGGGEETEEEESNSVVVSVWSLIWSRQRKGKIVVVVIGGCFSTIYKCHIYSCSSFSGGLGGPRNTGKQDWKSLRQEYRGRCEVVCALESPW